MNAREKEDTKVEEEEKKDSTKEDLASMKGKKR